MSVESALNSLPFVRWDRFVDHDPVITVYGWIGRPDGRSDFVVVWFKHDEPTWYTTSSAERSLEIGDALYGAGYADGDDHVDCQRVEAEWPGVENAVRLEATPDPQPIQRWEYTWDGVVESDVGDLVLYDDHIKALVR